MCSDAKTLPGISQPFPDIFDPANLLSNATSVQEVRRWRESEITHGRVAMLAALGWIVGEFVADKRLLVNGDGRITGKCSLGCMAVGSAQCSVPTRRSQYVTLDTAVMGIRFPLFVLRDVVQFEFPLRGALITGLEHFSILPVQLWFSQPTRPKLICSAVPAGPAIDHFQQVEQKGAVFWEPLVFAIGLAEAWRIGVGWANPTSEKFNQLRDDYNPGAAHRAAQPLSHPSFSAVQLFGPTLW